LYVLYRLIKASLRNFMANFKANSQQSRVDQNNVRGGRNVNLDDIEEAKYEEIKDDTNERKN